MARLSLGQKAERLLKFLLGLRYPRAVSALMAHGFTQQDLEEGWRLLQRLSGGRLSRLPEIRKVAPDDLKILDLFENHWFPIAQVTLKRRYPAVH